MATFMIATAAEQGENSMVDHSYGWRASDSCVAINCRNRMKKQSNIAFYNFPVEEDLRNKWITALRAGRENWQPNQYSKVCSAHFHGKCYYVNNGRAYLQPNSVPTLFDYSKMNIQNRKILLLTDEDFSLQPSGEDEVSSQPCNEPTLFHNSKTPKMNTRKRKILLLTDEDSSSDCPARKDASTQATENSVRSEKELLTSAGESTLAKGTLQINAPPPKVNVSHTGSLFADLSEYFWMQCSSEGWCFQYSQENIIFRIVENCIVRKALFVNRSTGKFEITVCGRPLSRSHKFFGQYMYHNHICLQTQEELWELLDKLRDWRPCSGISEPQCVKSWKSNPIKNLHFCNIRNSLYSDSCTMLMFKGRRCVQCARKRKLLLQKQRRWQAARARCLHNVTSLTFRGHKYLSRKELMKRCIMLGNRCFKNEKELKELDSCKSNYEELAHQMKRCICTSTSPSGTDDDLVHFFVREQLKAIHRKGINSRFRWHSAIVKFSAYIYKKSPAAYEALRGCGFLHLPGRQTLNRHLARFKGQSEIPSTDLDDVAVLFNDNEPDVSCDDNVNCELGDVTDGCGSDKQESENGGYNSDDCELYEENSDSELFQEKENLTSEVILYEEDITGSDNCALYEESIGNYNN